MELIRIVLCVFVTLMICNVIMAEDLTKSMEEKSEQYMTITPVKCDSSNKRRTCYSCREELQCSLNNKGVAKRCSGNVRYCNKGRCSKDPSPNCPRD